MSKLPQERLDKALLDAIRDKKDISEVQQLITQGAGVNAAGGFAWTPLHWAACGNQVAAIDALIAQGADVNAENIYGDTPLHIAATHGSFAALDTLLAHGANAHAKDKKGDTALHYAVMWDHVIAIDALVARGADVNAENEEKRTPLYEAVSQVRLAVIGALVGHGANMHAKDKKGNTLLQFAVKQGRTAAITTLVAHGANVHEKEEEGALLHWAARMGDVGAINALVESGADVNAKNKDSNTPLHFAANRRHIAAIDALVARGADVNAVGDFGFTPLHWAVIKAEVEVINALLNAGADYVQARIKWLEKHSDKPNPFDAHPVVQLNDALLAKDWEKVAYLIRNCKVEMLNVASLASELAIRNVSREDAQEMVTHLRDIRHHRIERERANLDATATAVVEEFGVEYQKPVYEKKEELPDYAPVTSSLEAALAGHIQGLPQPQPKGPSPIASLQDKSFVAAVEMLKHPERTAPKTYVSSINQFLHNAKLHSPFMAEILIRHTADKHHATDGETRYVQLIEKGRHTDDNMVADPQAARVNRRGNAR